MKEMYHSWLETSRYSDLLIAVSSNDPELDSYLSYLGHHAVVFPEKFNYTEIVNSCFDLKPKYEFYHLSNDDFVYVTNNWDQTFMRTLKQNDFGIAYGNDKFPGTRKPIPTAPFISGEIVRALHWLQLPTLKQLCGDLVWKTIGEDLGQLFYLPEISIKHNHFMVNTKWMDITYEKTNSIKMYYEDTEAFHTWHKGPERISNLGRIREFIYKTKLY